MSQESISRSFLGQSSVASQSSMPIRRTVTPPNASTRGIDVIVLLCIAVIYDPSLDRKRIVQVLSPIAERIPVPLDHVRSFTGVRRCLRILLSATLRQYGLTPAEMTQCAAQLPANAYPSFLGLTSDAVTWQNHVNTIASMYHKPCQDRGDCFTCQHPAFVIACFPASAWNIVPDPDGIVLRDNYHEEHGKTLGELSPTDQQRYFGITLNRVSSEPTVNARELRDNSDNTDSSRLAIRGNADPTRGPKGRSLIGTNRNSTKKIPDYSKGTLFPATAEQGIKAETDICLTCIRYGRSCKGTTMKFVKSARSDRPSQWKCECCQNPSRRCVWRPSMDEVTSYEKMFAADGGRSIAANTVQGRRDRAMRRSAGAVKVQDDDDKSNGTDDEHVDEDDDIDSYEEGGHASEEHMEDDDHDHDHDGEAEAKLHIQREE